MKRTVLFLIAIIFGVLSAQDLSRKVRSIRVSPDPKVKGLSSVSFPEIQSAWRKDDVKLALESPLDIGSLKKAEDSIQAIYRAKGQKVRVTHEIAEIPPRSLEINFRIVQQD